MEFSIFPLPTKNPSASFYMNQPTVSDKGGTHIESISSESGQSSQHPKRRKSYLETVISNIDEESSKKLKTESNSILTERYKSEISSEEARDKMNTVPPIYQTVPFSLTSPSRSVGSLPSMSSFDDTKERPRMEGSLSSPSLPSLTALF